jgi:phosphate acetyltransferase
MSFIDTIFEKLRQAPKRIVFPDGDDPRVVRACHEFYERKVGIPVLIGNREVIERVAFAEKVSLDHVAIVNPETASDLPAFCERFEKIDRSRKTGPKDTKALMTNPNYYATMMLRFGQVDGLVGGVNSYSASLLRPLIQLVKLLPHSPFISGCTVAELPDKKFGDDGVLFLADTGVVPEPNVEQLATIAVQTGLVARQVFDARPRIAMLSFSTKGSAKTRSTENVARAVAIVRELADRLGVEIVVDGEMQADAALVPEVAQKKIASSTVAGKANVLIFPDLNSGNIAAKLIQYLAGARVYGQILLGLSRPAVDLSRGADVEDIVSAAALVGLQAVEYRKLYPSEVVEPDVA